MAKKKKEELEEKLEDVIEDVLEDELDELLEVSVEVQAEPLEVAVQVEPELVAPEAQLVFTWDMAKAWLRHAHLRQRNVFESIRFERRGMPENDVPFLIDLVGNAIVYEYEYRYKKIRETRRGLLYVPVEFVNLRNPAFARLQEVERDEHWVTFCRK